MLIKRIQTQDLTASSLSCKFASYKKDSIGYVEMGVLENKLILKLEGSLYQGLS